MGGCKDCGGAPAGDPGGNGHGSLANELASTAWLADGMAQALGGEQMRYEVLLGVEGLPEGADAIGSAPGGRAAGVWDTEGLGALLEADATGSRRLGSYPSLSC